MDCGNTQNDLTRFDSVLPSLRSSVGNRIWCKSGSNPRSQNFEKTLDKPE